MKSPSENSPLKQTQDNELEKNTTVVRGERTVSKGFLLSFVALLSCVAILAGIIMFFAQFVYIFYVDVPVAEVVIRMYIVVFSLAVILTELDWTAPIRNSILSQSWTFRGLFYIFIGLLEFVLHIDIHDWRGQLIPFSVVVSASFMTLVGAIYSFMGIICLKKTKDERMARYIQLMSYLQVENALRQDNVI